MSTALKVCHVTQYCHAGGTAGTERYILELVRALRKRDVESSIAWLCGPAPTPTVADDEVTVIPVASPPSRTDPPDAGFASRFNDEVLERHRPDVAHFHTFGLAEAAAAKACDHHGIPYVFTYHSPAWSCRRETMLLWGDTPCDGEVRTMRCSACKLQERASSSIPVSYAGVALSGLLSLPAQFIPPGSLRRRIAFVSDTRRFRSALHRFLAGCRRVIACAEWSIPVLERNGAAPDRICHVPQGVPESFLQAATAPSEATSADSEDLFVVGYIGRVTPVKGIHILIDAFLKCPYPNARLRMLGWEPDEHSQEYVNRIQEKAADDPRIEPMPVRGFEAMVAEYRRLSLVAIPSVWLETGPLVLLEGAALGVPVWGSNRLGQISLLHEYGRVIDPNTPEAWQAALSKAFEDHAAGRRLKPRANLLDSGKLQTMSDVADEMMGAYAGAPGSRGA